METIALRFQQEGSKLIEVSKEQFYAHMNPLDVHPRIINKYEKKGVGYTSEWREPDGKIHGRDESGDFPFTPARYFLVESEMNQPSKKGGRNSQLKSRKDHAMTA